MKTIIFIFWLFPGFIFIKIFSKIQLNTFSSSFSVFNENENKKHSNQTPPNVNITTLVNSVFFSLLDTPYCYKPFSLQTHGLGFIDPKSSVMGSKQRSCGSATARERLRWTQELHDRFVEAVNRLGGPDSKSLLAVVSAHF